MCPEPANAEAHYLTPPQFQKELSSVLDVSVTLLASIERQMLEVLHWSL